MVDKIHLYCQDLDDPKYQLLTNKKEQAEIKNLNYPNALIEYSNTMDDVFPDIEDYNKKRRRKVLIVFDDMTSHIMSDKKS